MTNEEVKNFRVENKLTQKEFSKLLGYKDDTTIQKIESGQNKVPVIVSRVLKMMASMPENKRKKFFQEFQQ